MTSKVLPALPYYDSMIGEAYQSHLENSTNSLGRCQLNMNLLDLCSVPNRFVLCLLLLRTIKAVSTLSDHVIFSLEWLVSNQIPQFFQCCSWNWIYPQCCCCSSSSVSFYLFQHCRPLQKARSSHYMLEVWQSQSDHLYFE